MTKKPRPKSGFRKHGRLRYILSQSPYRWHPPSSLQLQCATARIWCFFVHIRKSPPFFCMSLYHTAAYGLLTASDRLRQVTLNRRRIRTRIRDISALAITSSVCSLDLFIVLMSNI